MRKDIKLYVPKLEELDYRQSILSQQETMSYNKGYDIDNQLYHKESGCIDFPKSNWESWYKKRVQNQPDFYYAYIQRTSDGKFVGEVNLHYNESYDWFEMGIVVEEQYRGQCYSLCALKQLLKVAFEELKANGVHNNFEHNRYAAVKTHVDSGFRIIDNYEGKIDLYISRTQYFEHIEK